MQKKIDFELDLTGLESPEPMFKTKEKIDQMLAGQVVLVKTTSMGSEQNIRNLVENHDVNLLSLNKENGVFHFLIEKA
jgi:tRNA 2-thiouridine synthesizing protein A